ncbi:MAG: GAP family protein [Humibacillus sp.]|nr:GAP family protein [Humibacillus sp.]MDN5776525.1 GAP family protein [Humibacillus sp.]
MDSVLWYVLPLAAAVALSIFPILAAVLLLLSGGPARASIGYSVGWSLGIIVLVATFAAGARLIPKDLSERTPPWVHYVEILVGAVLIVEGVVTAVHERRRAGAAAPPQWLQAASGLSPRRAFAFGVLMNVRPKNLALTLAAGLAIGAAPLTLIAGGVLVLLFAVVGVSTVVGLVLAYVLMPQRVQPLLKVLDTWLVSHAALVLRLSIIVIGVILVAVGIRDLAGRS